MSALPNNRMARIVAFTIAVEVGTALAALLAPGLLVQLLFGMPSDVIVHTSVRCFGIALVALAAAWWPDRTLREQVHPPFRGRLSYNGLMAIYLAYVGSTWQSGLLLWPAVVLHASVALLIVTTWRRYPLRNRDS